MEYRLVWFHELREYCDRYRDGYVAKLISTALRTTIWMNQCLQRDVGLDLILVHLL